MSGGSARLAALLFAAAGLIAPATAGAAAPDPLAPGEHVARSAGLALSYEVGGRGPVCIVPTPPWGPGRALYERTLGRLEDRFTVVWLDSRGTGRSGRPASTREYAWADLAGDLEALREHLGLERAWWLGHSEAGSLLLWYASRHPERVAGLVLIDAAATSGAAAGRDPAAALARRRDEPWFATALAALQAEPRDDAEMAASVRAALPLYFADPSRLAAWADVFAATPLSAHARRGHRDSRRNELDLRGELGRIAAPALVVVGLEDPFCGADAAREIHAGLPGSTLLAIEDAGHFPWLEQPDAFAAGLASFLDGALDDGGAPAPGAAGSGNEGSRTDGSGCARIVGPVWVLEGVVTAEGDSIAAPPGKHALTFNPDGRVVGRDACNECQGTYEADPPPGGAIRIRLGCTKVGCPDAVAGIRFQADVLRAVRYRLDRRLRLETDEGRTLVLAPDFP